MNEQEENFVKLYIDKGHIFVVKDKVCTYLSCSHFNCKNCILHTDRFCKLYSEYHAYNFILKYMPEELI